jgi:hypothetical protein
MVGCFGYFSNLPSGADSGLIATDVSFGHHQRHSDGRVRGGHTRGKSDRHEYGNATIRNCHHQQFRVLRCSQPAGGIYEVKSVKQGFETCLNKNIHLDPASSVQVNCTMKIGQVSQTVEVTASAVHVQTNSDKVSRLVDSTQMEQLPVNGRNFVSLLGLQPGVVQNFSFNSFNAMSLFASQCTEVNGLTGESNNILIDGAPSTRTRANGAIVAMPSMDSISEVNIITTGYMPEYSRAAGGQMVVNMKSGTDQYHGDAYEFLRNDAFDARYFFSPTVPKLTYNDFGLFLLVRRMVSPCQWQHRGRHSSHGGRSGGRLDRILHNFWPQPVSKGTLLFEWGRWVGGRSTISQ